MSRTRVFEWHKRFSEGREEVEDDERTGRPVTSRIEENIKKVNEIVRKDRRLSLRMISDLSNIDRETVRKILHEDLKMTKVCAKMQNNAPAHNALSVKQFLAKKSIPVLEHPPYSPDLALCGFYLFPKIKSSLKGTRFESVEDVKEKTADLLKRLTRHDMQHCFEQWKTRMQRCIDREGEYVEGD
nr:unnamed protein product [Callosobruchus chinensis]